MLNPCGLEPRFSQVTWSDTARPCSALWLGTRLNQVVWSEAQLR